MKESHQDSLKGFEFAENDLVLTAKYLVESVRFDLIYHKEKDKVLVLKDGELASLDSLNPKEVESYKEALEICICYHHNKENEPLH